MTEIEVIRPDVQDPLLEEGNKQDDKEKDKNSKKGKRTRYEALIPPDGGWGWMVIAGYTLTSIVLIPIIQNFGLIFKQRLSDLEMTSTDITSIISINSAIGQIMGVFQGPLLKRFGYRKMAFFGVATVSLGTFLTGLSQSFAHFIITYGIITSIGFTYTLTSFSLAMSCYFREKRSRASGILMGFSGLGPVFMPQFVTFSLGMYGVTQTAFLLAALNAHGFIGASLLRPIKWYRRRLSVKSEGDTSSSTVVPPNDDSSFEKSSSGSRSITGSNNTSPTEDSRYPFQPQWPRRPSNVHLCPEYTDKAISDSLSICSELFNGIGPTYNGRRRGSRIRSVSESEDDHEVTNQKKNVGRQNSGQGSFLKQLKEEEVVSYKSQASFYYSCSSNLSNAEDSLNLGNQLGRKHTTASKLTLDMMGSSLGIAIAPSSEIEDESSSENSIENDDSKIKKNICRKWLMLCLNYIHKTFDLDLLKERKYIIITLGLSIAIIGELMFSLLTPFILAEVGLSTQETAYFMSIIAIADIISRFISPYIGELVRFDSRLMYVVALFCLVFSRACLLFASGMVGLGVVAVLVGFAKGVRTVFWIQVLPDNVDPDRLPSAMSIQNLINGILILISGPLAGKIVEINNSYLNIVYFSNALTGVTVLLWAGDYIAMWIMRKKNDEEDDVKPYFCCLLSVI